MREYIISQAIDNLSKWSGAGMETIHKCENVRGISVDLI